MSQSNESVPKQEPLTSALKQFLGQEVADAVDTTLILQELDFDPQLIYCPKTGRPIGYRFPGEIKTLLRVHKRERAIEILRAANRTAVSLAWLETNPKTLAILEKEDPASWIVLAFEKLLRIKWSQVWEYRDINQWHNAKVELHSFLSKSPLSMVRLLADNLNGLMQLNIKKLEIPWKSLDDILADHRLRDGTISAQLQHIAHKEFLRIDSWERAIDATSYLVRQSRGPSMYRGSNETQVEETIRNMRIAGFSLHDNSESLVAGRYTEELKKPRYSGKAYTLSGKPLTGNSPYSNIAKQKPNEAPARPANTTGKLSFAEQIAKLKAEKKMKD